MPDPKHYTVIGLGSFGGALAVKLSENHCRVTGVEARRETAERLKNALYEVVIGDATEKDTLAHLPLKDSDGVIIGLGEDITLSLLATLHAKDLGARRIIVKGVTPEHGRLLNALGVDQVIYPETDIARQLGDKLTFANLVDFLPIGDDYSFAEYAAPESFIGKTLQEINIRRHYGVWVLGVKDALTQKLTMFPDGLYRLGPDQMLMVVGKDDDLEKLGQLQ